MYQGHPFTVKVGVFLYSARRRPERWCVPRLSFEDHRAVCCAQFRTFQKKPRQIGCLSKIGLFDFLVFSIMRHDAFMDGNYVQLLQESDYMCEYIFVWESGVVLRWWLLIVLYITLHYYTLHYYIDSSGVRFDRHQANIFLYFQRLKSNSFRYQGIRRCSNKVCLCVGMRVCVFVSIRACLCVHVCVFICMCVCAHACVCACVSLI